jgi:DNA polymerase III epsilon subunit-like protein
MVDAETPTGRDPRNIPGVSAQEVKNARPLRIGHLDILFTALDNRVVVMHNAAHDWAFIENEFFRHKRLVPRPLARVCTYSWARRAKLSGSLTLGDLCERFDIPLNVAHHAWYDARATFYLYITWINNPDFVDVPCKVEYRSMYFPPKSFKISKTTPISLK